MKKLPSLLLVAVSLSLVACAGDEPTPERRSAAQTGERSAREEDENDSSEKKARLGMSKRQVEEMYGEPSEVRRTARGEVWQYRTNRGQAYIPYNFGYKPKMSTFTFDASGTLVDFEQPE